MTSEVSAQTQTDMITRVFWIAVSLFESDYDHEYLMAVELLNQVLAAPGFLYSSSRSNQLDGLQIITFQVMTFLNLGRPESRERLEKVLHRLNWTDFPGLQALVLKVSTTMFMFSV